MKPQGNNWLVLVLVILLSTGSGVLAQDDDSEEKKKEPEKSGHTETVVVTASRTEQPLDTVPAAVTVVTSEQLQNTPADNYGDVLRSVPGVNVSQMSARDIQVTSRGATNSLATSQLVLLDNRSLYLDFFGFVMWDFAPMDPNQIKQVEVVRGPGSAVWGANAMTGVVNILTKAPKENPGTTVIVGGGELGTVNGSVSHAGVNGDFSYRLDASYYEQDSYDRPTGTIPGTNTPYPAYENQGTKQPKANLRFDWDTANDSTWSVRGGWAATGGIIHTGIGPFDIENGTSLSFVSAEWQHNAQRASFFINALDGEAPNLLTVDGTTGLPIFFTFESQTYNFDYTNTSIIGGKHLLTYGGNARHNEFDLSIAPLGDSRDEFGAFFQDEILLGDKVRWLIGVRVDDLDPIDVAVSPRTSLLVKVADGHTIRFSYNRAFRAPSMVQNYLDATIFTPQLVDPAPSPALAPFALGFNSAAVGNIDLVEEQLDAIEVGWVGLIGDTTLTVSAYRNETADSVDFFTAGAYPADPTGLPSQPSLLTDLTDSSGMFVICPLGTELRNCDPDGPGPSPDLYSLTFSQLPFMFSYRNIGEIVDQGVEFSVNTKVNDDWSYFINYSWQDEPAVKGIVPGTINSPPEHRANAGFAYNADRWYINGNVNYQDEAFWTDVLDSRFWGPTESFTSVNASMGVRFGDSTTLSVSAYNLFDEDVQQHVFGDLLQRRVVGQLMFRF
jgi:iron complex outermembrane receptor protein